MLEKYLFCYNQEFCFMYSFFSVKIFSPLSAAYLIPLFQSTFPPHSFTSFSVHYLFKIPATLLSSRYSKCSFILLLRLSQPFFNLCHRLLSFPIVTFCNISFLSSLLNFLVIKTGYF